MAQVYFWCTLHSIFLILILNSAQASCDHNALEQWTKLRELKVDTQNQTAQQSPEVQKISGSSAKVLQLESAQAPITIFTNLELIPISEVFPQLAHRL